MYILSHPQSIGKSFIKRFVPSCLLLSFIVFVTTFAFSVICRCSAWKFIHPVCHPSGFVSWDCTLRLVSHLYLGIVLSDLVSAICPAVRLDSPLYKNYHTFQIHGYVVNFGPTEAHRYIGTLVHWYSPILCANLLCQSSVPILCTCSVESQEQ